jgi:hypothetical protein
MDILIRNVKKYSSLPIQMGYNLGINIPVMCCCCGSENNLQEYVVNTRDLGTDTKTGTGHVYRWTEIKITFMICTTCIEWDNKIWNKKRNKLNHEKWDEYENIYGHLWLGKVSVDFDGPDIKLITYCDEFGKKFLELNKDNPNYTVEEKIYNDILPPSSIPSTSSSSSLSNSSSNKSTAIKPASTKRTLYIVLSVVAGTVVLCLAILCLFFVIIPFLLNIISTPIQ